MISRIEIKNFQSHKDTSIDFCAGINALNGESDNGKSAVIRAIKWVCENRPLGTDKLNSNWNRDFKEKMSVKLFLDNGDWVERIRTKSRNGYTYFENGVEVDLSATGTEVPQKIKDILKMSDVNFQFQMDAPYLLSLPSSEASKYFNRLIHLDSIDKMLSEADSEKRRLNAEKKVVEKDMEDCSRELESLAWVDEAAAIQKRVEKYSDLIERDEQSAEEISLEISRFEDCSKSLVDLTEQNEIISEIDSIEIADFSELERDLETFVFCLDSSIDLTEQNEIISEIDSIEVEDFSELEREISLFESLSEERERFESEKSELEGSLPEICPLCGSKIKGGESCVH